MPEIIFIHIKHVLNKIPEKALDTNVNASVNQPLRSNLGLSLYMVGEPLQPIEMLLIITHITITDHCYSDDKYHDAV
jgi:hypothetical protein